MITAIASVLVFGGIILVHELGHFIVAKRCGVLVHEFAIGMGPAIFQKQKGETVYSIRAIPIGGYVMMEGEDDSDCQTEGSFSQKPLLSRIGVLAAGSLNNLILGYILLVILTFINGYVGTTYVAVFNEGAVSSSVLQLGDKIVKINGHRVWSSNDITYEFIRDRDGLIDMVVQRDGKTVALEPIQFKMEQLADGASAIDLDFKVAAFTAKPLDYVVYPINWGVSLAKQVWGSLVDLITGRYAVNQLSGPVGVVSAIGEASKLGFKNLLMLAAFLTINIGIFNLIPFPVLDGGKIFIALIETLFRRNINGRVLDGIMTVSVAMLIMLVLYATWNDILRLFN